MTGVTTIVIENDETRIVAEELADAARVAAQAAAAAAAQSATDATTNGAAQVALAAAQVSLAEAQADRAEAAQAIVGTAADVLAARDAALIYKDGAEDAQAEAQDAAADAEADRAATAADRAAVATDRAYVASVIPNLVPFSPIAQEQIYTAGGTVAINNTGYVVTNLRSIALSPVFGPNPEALRDAHPDTQNAFAAGYQAMANFRGYNSKGIGWRALYYSIGRASQAYGTHAGEATNMAGREIHGWGNRASGTITFTGLPSDGDPVEIGGVTLTARSAPSLTTEFQIAGTVADTVMNAVRAFIALGNAALGGLLLRPSAAGTDIEVLAAGGGTWANSVTLSAGGAAMAVSGATLSGGTIATSTGSQDDYQGLVALGQSAVKRFDPVFARRAMGVLTVTGQETVGRSITLGIATTVGTSASTAKRFVCVASGASGLQFNQGANAAAQRFELFRALIAYKAANPTHVATSQVDFYLSNRGVEIVASSTGTTFNAYRTESNGVAITPSRGTLTGGSGASNTAPIGIGINIEAGNSVDMVAVGFGAGTTSQGNGNVLLGRGSGSAHIGNGNVYAFGSGSGTIGDNNVLLGPVLGGASQQAWIGVSGITSTGRLTLSAPLTDPQLLIGRRFNFSQRNNTDSNARIRNDGAIIASFTGIIVSPTAVQIVDFSDGDGAGGTSVYSVTGSISGLEIAPFYRVLDNAVSWGDDPVTNQFDVGNSRHAQARVKARVLTLPNGRMQMAELVAGAAPAIGNILFATANGNFAADETVTINSVMFTAKAESTFATPNTSMIRWFPIGANMWLSLNNLLACIRNSDANDANSRLVNRATYWLTAVTGSGWRLNVRVDADTAGNTFTLATSKTGATVTAPTGASAGTLPTASSSEPPQDGEIRLISAWPRSRNERALMQYTLAQDAWRFVGGA